MQPQIVNMGRTHTTVLQLLSYKRYNTIKYKIELTSNCTA